MNDDVKITDMVVVVKLSTGELLMALCTQIMDTAISLAFPYEIVDREVQIEGTETTTVTPVFLKFCPFTANRHFVLSGESVIFCKDASQKYAESFIKTAMIFDNEEFKMFVENLKENSNMTYSSIEEIEDALGQLEKKLGREYDIMFDAPKTIQ